MSIKLLTEHHLEFLSLKGGYRGSSEFTLVRILHCWKSHVVAYMYHKRHKIRNILSKENSTSYFFNVTSNSIKSDNQEIAPL